MLPRNGIGNTDVNVWAYPGISRGQRRGCERCLHGLRTAGMRNTHTAAEWHGEANVNWRAYLGISAGGVNGVPARFAHGGNEEKHAAAASRSGRELPGAPRSQPWPTPAL